MLRHMHQEAQYFELFKLEDGITTTTTHTIAWYVEVTQTSALT